MTAPLSLLVYYVAHMPCRKKLFFLNFLKYAYALLRFLALVAFDPFLDLNKYQRGLQPRPNGKTDGFPRC